MARLDIRLVRRELKVIQSTSNGVLEAIEKDASSFPPLEFVPTDVDTELQSHGIVLRKAKVISGRHSFRLLLLHFGAGEERALFVDAFPRKANYPIDWEFVKSIAESS